MFEPILEPPKVSPRVIWPHEAWDFTPWLAENLSAIAVPLNMELEIEAREKNVEGFRADLVCRNPNDNSRIVIENQLHKSDHSHLGQILTYAANLQAVTLVWVSTELRRAHRVTLDWHNEITDAQVRFFGLEFHTRGDDSFGYTVQFDVIAKPMDWESPTGTVPYQIRR